MSRTLPTLLTCTAREFAPCCSNVGAAPPVVPTAATQAPQIAVEPETATKEQLAPLWKVICHDDPITTMDFVVDMLTKIFRQPLPRAFEIMLQVHNDGAAVIGLWPESVARKKVNRAHAMARADQFPLTLSLEKDE